MSRLYAAAGVFLAFACSASGVEPGADADADRLDDVQASGRVDPALVDILRREGVVRADITFDGALLSSPLAPESRAFVAATKLELLDSMGSEFTAERHYKNVPVLTGSITSLGVERALADDRVVFIEWDGDTTTGQLAEALPLIGLSGVRDDQNLRGVGVRVAVVDSGIDATHPDLQDAVIEERCFCSGGDCCPSGGKEGQGPGSAQDDHGHGTHIAGIIASAGSESPLGGAPLAKLVSIKVLDSTLQSCCTSDIIGALDSLIEDGQKRVDIVNLSVASSAFFDGDCDDAIPSYAAAVNLVHRAGIVVIAATGNAGKIGQLPAPACFKNAISVGAVFDDFLGPLPTPTCSDDTTAPDRIPCWVSRSDRLDVLAPGGRITSTALGGGTVSKTGTSMAAPMVSACSAALLEADPTLTPDELRGLLTSSPVRIADDATGATFPRLDCAAAVAAAKARPTL